MLIFEVGMYLTKPRLPCNQYHTVHCRTTRLLVLRPCHFALYYPLHLEEPPQPPDLEDGLADDNAEDEDVPPLDTAVCALCSVAVGALADDDVGLLVLDLGQEFGEFLDCLVPSVTVFTHRKPHGRGDSGLPSASSGSAGESASDT